MQQKGKTSLALALAIASVPTLTGTLAALPRTASAAEPADGAPAVYADWKFNASSAQGSAEDNTLVISDASGNGNDLELVVSDNGAKTKMLEIKGGVIENKVASADEVKVLANIPPKPVLIGQLLGLLTNPMRSLAVAVSEVAKKQSA